MASSTKLLELTLADASDVVNRDNPEFKLMDLRCLRRLITVQGATISWWLSDEVLRSYMLLINDKARELSLNVHCFNSFFFSTFAEQGYKGVRRWSTSVCLRLKVPTIFSLEKIVVPINLDNTHWTFIVANLRCKVIRYYDSLHACQSTAMEYMERFHR